MRKETFLVNGAHHSLFIHTETRNDVRVSLGKTGVHVRLPFGISRQEYAQQLFKAKTWAREKLKHKPLVKDKGWRRYETSDQLTVGNETYTLDIAFVETQGSTANINDKTIQLRISATDNDAQQREAISVLLSRLLAREQLPFVQERVAVLNKEHFGFVKGKISLKYMTSRWGSCSENGNINLSTRLLFAPDDVFDYVCIHELAHLEEKNHTRAFWKLVKTAMPDYKEKIGWLKQHGDACWF